MKKLDLATAIMILIAALSWGGIGVLDVNLVSLLFENSDVERVIYTLFGVAAVYQLIYWRSIHARWKG